jgi:hypothetical protein
LVQGDADEVIEPAAVFEWALAQSPAPDIRRFAGGGHFFHGRLHELRQTVVQFLTSRA